MRKFLLILLGFSVLSGSAFDRTKYSLRNEVIVQSKQNESSYTTVAYPGLLKMSDNDNFVFKIYDIDGVGVAPTNCVIVSNPVGGISPLVKRLDMGQVICGIDSLQMGNDKFYYLSFDNPEPDSYLKLIKESGLCKSVDFNYYYLDSFQGAVSPGDDVYYNRQWYLRDVYGINPQTAWNSYDGEGVRVAILDSGIDNTHPDLAQNLIGGIDFSVDANPNGQYNSQAKEREHGTCVAGLIGAVDNSIGIVGVAPKCEMIPIKITDAGAKVSSKSAIEALKYAVFTQKADVISFSLKIPLDDASIFVALDNAYSQGRENKGCVLVASSGNNAFESIAFPANYKNVIAVGSSNADGDRSDFSSFGEELDVVAPGEVMYTTTVGNGYTSTVSGTSYAAPLVSGLAALILNKNSQLQAADVAEIICRSAKKLPNYPYQIGKEWGTWNEETGYGLIDVSAAISRTPSISYTESNLQYGEIRQEAHLENNISYPLLTDYVSNGTARVYPGGYAYIKSSILNGYEFYDKSGVAPIDYQFYPGSSGYTAQLCVTMGSMTSAPAVFRFINKSKYSIIRLNVWAKPLPTAMSVSQKNKTLQIKIEDQTNTVDCRVENVLTGEYMDTIIENGYGSADVSGMGNGVFVVRVVVEKEVLTEKILVK